MFIVNPLSGSTLMNLFSTHPPISERVRILRAMAGGASFVNYDAAYRKIHGGGGVVRTT
jgi:heat shock protein HtpX